MNKLLGCFFLAIWVASCGSSPQNNEAEIENSIPEDLKTIPIFLLINQNGDTINESVMADKVAVVDFFFTTCPTICPIMKTNMLRVYEEFEDRDDFVILSHTIDPEYDNQAVLFDYAKKLGVDARVWHFLTGDKDQIYELAEYYHITAEQDASAPGGFIHSGAFILINKNAEIIGIYDGTVQSQVEKMIAAIQKL